ncbi:MAG TPA: 16S rRNA (cytosine(967)-C(5))-methyltransferase RsmB [Verrucomicrobiae bacterium]
MTPLNVVNEQNPRQIAARILSQRLNNGEFTENLLETALATARLSPADRGLCHELVCGVVRWQATLDRLIARKTTPGREPRPALVNLLRLGLYQIFWLDRIPPHAAVHETVEQAKRSGYVSQSGFINAILRAYLREFDEVKKILADMKISQPALGWSHPEWLVERWRKNFGDEKTRALLEWNNTPPKTFARVNTLKTDATKLIERWREENVECDFCTRDWTGENLAFELKSHPPLNSLGSFRAGSFYIQDPSTLLAPILLDAQPGETILDLCAAPGGKTTFIAQQMNNEGKIVAHDSFADRLKLIRENCTRLGVTCAEVTATFNFQPATFDRVLVDAPCSNTGVMRRRVDLRWLIQPSEIERLRATQLVLLKQAATVLKSGGIIVYSTCSLEPEENSELVKEFLATNSNFKLENERQLLPFTANVDGAYVARLKLSN